MRPHSAALRRRRPFSSAGAGRHPAPFFVPRPLPNVRCPSRRDAPERLACLDKDGRLAGRGFIAADYDVDVERIELDAAADAAGVLGGDEGRPGTKKRVDHMLPWALLGKAAPLFKLAPVEGRTLGLSSDDLKGEVSLVNVFASWCAPCRAEHPLLLQIARDRSVPIFGINYKDRPADASQWLDSLGDPYARTGADLDGRVAIDWGVSGAPETFVVDADGRIAFKQTGPMTEQVLNETILPVVARLRDASKGVAR